MELVKNGKLNIPKWTEIYNKLEPGQDFIITDQSIIQQLHELPFGNLVHKLGSTFVLFRDYDEEQNPRMIFKKIKTLTPEITSPEAINEIISRSGDVSDGFNKDPEKFICQTVGNKKLRLVLGSGAQGSVFQVKEWRSDVVVKELTIDMQYREPFVLFAKPKKGNYEVEYDQIEVLASAALSEVASGERSDLFCLHFPRFAGYFTCPIPKRLGGTRVGLYLIIEKLENLNFMKYMKSFKGGKEELKTVKTNIWQALFAIFTMNKLGWMHQDSSDKNFLMRDTKNFHWRGQNLSEANGLVYYFNGKRYVTSVTEKIPVLTDFGYSFRNRLDSARMADQPNIYSTENDSGPFRLNNRFRKSFDAGYFLMTIIPFGLPTYNFHKELEPLFKKIVDMLMKSNPKVKIDFDELMEEYHKRRKEREIKKIVTEKWRIREEFDECDFQSLLDDEFFADVVNSSKK